MCKTSTRDRRDNTSPPSETTTPFLPSPMSTETLQLPLARRLTILPTTSLLSQKHACSLPSFYPVTPRPLYFLTGLFLTFLLPCAPQAFVFSDWPVLALMPSAASGNPRPLLASGNHEQRHPGPSQAMGPQRVIFRAKPWGLKVSSPGWEPLHDFPSHMSFLLLCTPLLRSP